jgi:hypothetical protein
MVKSIPKERSSSLLSKPLSLQVKREAKLTRLESLLVGVEFAFRRSPFP